MSDDALVAAARFEVESRDRHYPAQVASGKLTDQEATIDFQAWHCILGFIETGQFKTVYAGGVDGQTEVGWPRAEAAADRAVASTAEALTGADVERDEAKAQRLGKRLDALRAIAKAVSRQRAHIDAINRGFRERRQLQQQASPVSGQPDAEEFKRRHRRQAA